MGDQTSVEERTANLMAKRDLVFVSHATPEDNTFALWLSTRLKLLGYEVWSDVTQLFGGEKWWEDIDEVIGGYTCRFVLVITRESLAKPGVRRELKLALKAETDNGLKNFIIPIIIDDSPFTGQPLGLSERNIISFSENWANGLKKLSKAFERDGIEKSTHSVSTTKFVNLNQDPKVILNHEKDVVISNWLSILEMPKSLNFYKLPVNISDYKDAVNSFNCPWFEYGGHLATFAYTGTVKGFFQDWEDGITKAASVELECVKKGYGHKGIGFSSLDGAIKINQLLLQSWDKAMRDKGLRPYSMANNRTAWFFPYQKPYIGRLSYPAVHGDLRNRAIVGRSEANDVYWHFCLSAKPMFGKEPKFCTIPHVVFTEDGQTPISDDKRLHRLRRRFCKMWWNDKWRDILLSYLYQLSEGSPDLQLPVGSRQCVKVSIRPLMLNSPVSLVAQEKDELDDEIEDVFVDIKSEDEESDAYL